MNNSIPVLKVMRSHVVALLLVLVTAWRFILMLIVDTYLAQHTYRALLISLSLTYLLPLTDLFVLIFMKERNGHIE